GGVFRRRGVASLIAEDPRRSSTLQKCVDSSFSESPPLLLLVTILILLVVFPAPDVLAVACDESGTEGRWTVSAKGDNSVTAARGVAGRISVADHHLEAN